jgi:hypothetical protein
MKATWRGSAHCASDSRLSLQRRRRFRHLAAPILAVALGALPLLDGAASAGQVGNWQFNGTLNNEVPGGAPMAVNGGWSANFVNTTIGGNPATVLSFPAFSNTQSLQMVNQAAANGGGAKTNHWSIVMDINFPDVSDFRALWQTDQVISANDGDFFINNGGIGISSSYHGALVSGSWARVAVTIERNGGAARFNKYINGALVGVTDSTAPVDGRHSVDAILNLFADDDDETGAGFVNSVAYYDHLLTANEIGGLGGASAAGVPAVPEPTSIALCGFALTAATLAQRARRS